MISREEMRASVERGLARAVIVDGQIVVVATEEGIETAKRLSRGLAVFCNHCGAEYPQPGVLPKYSTCPPCRAGDPVVDFIKRP
jgi:hypothetical protein